MRLIVFAVPSIGLSSKPDQLRILVLGKLGVNYRRAVVSSVRTPGIFAIYTPHDSVRFDGS